MSDRRQLSAALQAVKQFSAVAPQFGLDGAGPRRDGVAGCSEVSFVGHGRVTDRRDKYFPSLPRCEDPFHADPETSPSGEASAVPRLSARNRRGVERAGTPRRGMALDNTPTVEPTPVSRAYLSSAVDVLLLTTVAAMAVLTFATVVLL